jgi:hypothetical protein
MASSVTKFAPTATYSNGRGERSHTAPTDLNVPLRLECELLGRDPWLGKAAG